MNILITGFAPFGGETVNPAYEAVKRLPDEIGGAELIKTEIPTSFAASVGAMEALLAAHKPDAVVCVGQDGGSAQIAVERVAINLAEAHIPDNDGVFPQDQPLRADGAPAYFATLPVHAIVKTIRDHGIPSGISYTAGAYVCNCVMYNTLYLAAQQYPGLRAGFIHVPYAPAQVVGKPVGTASMALDVIAEGLTHAIEAILAN